MAAAEYFGRLPSGETVERLTLRGGGLSCAVLTYGGAIQSLEVPDRRGRPVDVALGFDNLAGYLAQDKYMGAIVGRCANRIGGSAFALEGRRYPLFPNEGANHLHGGRVGFDKKVWTVDGSGADWLALTLVSPHGEEGYPGTLSVRAIYRLAEGALTLTLEGESDRPTLCNLTSHAYFNLGGHAAGPVTGHTIQLLASHYLPTDGQSIPTGQLAPVEGTPMDLRRPRPIGAGVEEDFPQLRQAGGYDHTWAIDGPWGTLRPAARAFCPETGIALSVDTTLPGVQFYTGNYLDGCPAGKGGAVYRARHGFCLESQFYPDSPHHPDFPQPILVPGQLWRQETVFRFSN